MLRELRALTGERRSGGSPDAHFRLRGAKQVAFHELEVPVVMRVRRKGLRGTDVRQIPKSSGLHSQQA